jgi:putative transport protein
LGAAQQSLATIEGIEPERLALPALACAVSYPAAIAGLLGTLLFLKVAFRIDPRQEALDYTAQKRRAIEPLLRRTLVVENDDIAGRSLDEIYHRVGEGFVVSRVRQAAESEVRAARREMRLGAGDVILAVGPMRLLDELERAVGKRSDEDLFAAPGDLSFWKIAVTSRNVLGKTCAELGLAGNFGVEVTRITRGDIEMTAVPSLRLQFGDVLQVVGTHEQLQKAAVFLGNSLKKLNETQFIPLFAGICLGVVVGSIPLAVPGLSLPLRLGLAGGPLIVALALGRIGRIGGLVWHMPQNANHAFREFGVSLFFATLGLAAGEQFFPAVMSPRGMTWLATGFVITVLPLLAVGIWARLIERMNYVTLGGLLSGGMTNPPALAFVSNLCGSDAPGVAYATVYPLTTLMRILIAQMLVLLLCK